MYSHQGVHIYDLPNYLSTNPKYILGIATGNYLNGGNNPSISHALTTPLNNSFNKRTHNKVLEVTICQK